MRFSMARWLDGCPETPLVADVDMVATIGASVLSAVNARITKGLLPVGEVSLTHYQASLDPYHEAEARIELDAATAGAQLDPVSEDEHIAGVNDLKGLV